MTFIQKFTVLLGALLFSSVVFAAGMPANVREVYANLHEGNLTVTWAAVQDAAYYRVYYSHESIVGHGGDYDDVDRTQGKETSYTFSSLPYTSGKVFVAVLAVGQDGVESDGFETEASVDLGSAETLQPVTPVTAASSSAPLQPETSIPMAVSEIKTVSATGVLITFTKPLPQGIIFPPLFFMVSDASGVVLETGTGVTVGSGTTVLLTTAAQEPQKTYFLSILQPIPALDGTNLPTNAMKMSFLGFVELQQTSSSAQSLAPVIASSSSFELPPADIPYVENPLISQPVLEELAPPKNIASDGLPDSGVGLLGITALSGLLAGRRIRRKK